MADYHQRRTKPMKKIIQKHMQKQGIFQDRQDATAIASSEVNETNAAIVEEDKE